MFLLGAVYIFTKIGGSFSEAQTLLASNGADGDYFGISVSLYGGVLAVGAYSADVALKANAGIYVASIIGYSLAHRLFMFRGRLYLCGRCTGCVDGDTGASRRRWAGYGLFWDLGVRERRAAVGGSLSRRHRSWTGRW